MTFPRFRPLLRRAGVDTQVVAIGATRTGGVDDGAEVGLAIGWINPGPAAQAELLSVFVRSDCRGRGCGNDLLAELERAVAGAGCRSIASVYMTRLPAVEAFEAMLRRRGWSPPSRRMLIFRARRDRLREADWFDLFAAAPAGTVIKPWAEVTDAERAALARAMAEKPERTPDDVNPFRFEGRGLDGAEPEPGLSLACVVDGAVVGWNLAHRIDQRAARFSCSYVWPEMQGRLPLLTLWDHAFHRLEDAGYESVSWAVSPHHEAMVRFNEQMLLPYVEDYDETRGSTKTFG
jgi:ribosomal protein S18 acetylase RimI-like enzyme